MTTIQAPILILLLLASVNGLKVISGAIDVKEKSASFSSNYSNNEFVDMGSKISALQLNMLTKKQIQSQELQSNRVLLTMLCYK